MKRFFFLSILGGGGVIGGHIALSAGIHPEHLASPLNVLQRSLALVLGTAVLASGMLGLAEGYEQAAARFCQLLGAKRLPAGDDLALRDLDQLQTHNHAFWRAYRRSGGAICLFLTGLLALTVALSRSSFALYLTGVTAGVACLGTVTLLMVYTGMRGMWRTHAFVGRAAEVLSRQPDAQPSEDGVEKTTPRYSLFESPSSRARHVERRGRVPRPRVRA